MSSKDIPPRCRSRRINADGGATCCMREPAAYHTQPRPLLEEDSVAELDWVFFEKGALVFVDCRHLTWRFAIASLSLQRTYTILECR